MVNIAPIHTKFICFINDDNFLSFICLDMLLTTNIAKAIDIDTNMNFLKITFINATPPINIGFNTTTDDRSNIKNTTIDIPVINTNSKTSTGTTVTGTITDNANNSNTCTIVIKADIENPKITAKSNPLTLGNQDYEFTNNINSTFGGLGGNIACNPAQSKKTGTYDVTCTATSNNGKSSTVTFTTKHSYAATATKVTDYNNCTGYKTCESSGGSSKSNCHYNSGTKETHCDYRFTCSCTGREETLSQNTNSSHTHCASYGTKTQYTCPNGGTLSGTTCVY